MLRSEFESHIDRKGFDITSIEEVVKCELQLSTYFNNAQHDAYLLEYLRQGKTGRLHYLQDLISTDDINNTTFHNIS